jgi:2'-5' RNA ligase
MGKLRLFVAVPLPAATASMLAGRVPERAGLRPLPAENLHVTVHFLGGVEEEAAAGLPQALATAVAGQEPFTLQLAELVAMPKRRPRMLWAALKPDDRFTALAAAVAEEVAPSVPAARPPRPARPHITLARGDASGVGEPLEGGVAVDRLELVRSHLGRGGARYETIAVAPLGISG